MKGIIVGVALLFVSGCATEVPGVATPGSVSAAATTTTTPKSDVFDLKVGDCLADLDEVERDQVADVSIVPCSDPHEAEVYAETDLSGSRYPGDDEVETESDEFCVVEFEEFVGAPYEDADLEITYLLPTWRSWLLGDRNVDCILYDPEGDLDDSAEGSDL